MLQINFIGTYPKRYVFKLTKYEIILQILKNCKFGNTLNTKNEFGVWTVNFYLKM